MAIADDLKLVQLAREPARELFPVLNRAAAMTPLVVLFAIVPGLLVLDCHAFSEWDAQWGLKSLAVLSADSFEDFVDPPATEIPVAVRWHPPLGTWLTSICLLLVDPSWASRLVLASYLATLALVVLTFVLVRRMLGARIGFLAAILLGCREQLLQQVLVPAPYSLGVVFALVTFWGFWGHLRKPTNLVSLRLLVGGIGLGLCLLAAGRLAIAVIAILLVHVLALRIGSGDTSRKNGHTTHRRLSPGGPALMSLLALVLTALSIGGWWQLMMSQRHGLEFLAVWIGGVNPVDSDANVSPDAFRHTEFAFGVLRLFVMSLVFSLGFALLGFWQACREIMTQPNSQRRQPLQFVVVWNVCGLIALYATQRFGFHSSEEFGFGFWQSFSLIPLIVLAAFGVDEVAQRRVAPPTFMAGMLLTTIALVLHFDLLHVAFFGWDRGTWIGVFLLGLLLTAGYRLHTYCRSSEINTRRLLAACTLLFVLADLIFGVISTRASAHEDHGVATLQRRLASIGDVSDCTLVTTAEPPLRLRYLIMSAWPQAKLSVVNRFEPVPDDRPEIAALDGHPQSHAATAPVNGTDAFGVASDRAAQSLHIVVVWGKDAVPLGSAKGVNPPLEPIDAPLFFGDRLVSIYHRN